MLRSKLKHLLPVGVLMLALGLILHTFIHGRYTEFAAGFLIGTSAVFIIAGFVGRFRQPVS